MRKRVRTKASVSNLILEHTNDIMITRFQNLCNKQLLIIVLDLYNIM